jgi:hypothetical protein
MRVNRTAGFVVVLTPLDDSSAAGSVNEDKDIHTVYHRYVGFGCAWCVNGLQDCAGLTGDEFCKSNVIKEGYLHGFVPVVGLSPAFKALSLMKGRNLALSLAARMCAL